MTNYYRYPQYAGLIFFLFGNEAVNDYLVATTAMCLLFHSSTLTVFISVLKKKLIAFWTCIIIKSFNKSIYL